jgi:oligo-alginate lyase
MTDRHLSTVLAGYLRPTLLMVAASLSMQAAKQASALYPPRLTERAKANAAKYSWGAQLRKTIVDSADYWAKLSDEQLWDMMFGATLLRSHHVWSSGFCPACRKPVPMYDWKIDAVQHPWKARCPHCRELFPKNDFHKFYRSGLDEHGIFQPRRADRALLVNLEHPDPADPLHRFGVDDGTGYAEGNHRWYFIGAYLKYGQFESLVLHGIATLAAAYNVTGEQIYARKAAILLDRVADVWPTFDFAAQGLVYERYRYGGGVAGYVNYSIDSAYDVRQLTLAYDQIFEAARRDPELIRFLAAQARRYHLDNPKSTFADVQRNIEDRILRDALAHPEKIRTNYPGTDGALALVKTVLDWPANREEVLKDIGTIVERSTAIDGLTGEKGLTGYATISTRYLGQLIEQYARTDATVLPELLKRYPKLRETYRFHYDTWIGFQYYPYSGDCGSFATRSPNYVAIDFHHGDDHSKYDVDPAASMYSFFWRLYRATGDRFYLQLMLRGNEGKFEGMPYDLYAEDPDQLVRDVKRTAARHAGLPDVASVDKKQWHLAILRSPGHTGAGAVWMDYDSVPTAGIKGHIHRDAMNLGLVAKGLDLLPEFGYPAVQFGDWHTPQARWHIMTAAHNTVVVDGKDQIGGEGRTTLWIEGEGYRVMRASSANQYNVRQYERTAVMVDTAGDDFYVLDVFRVVGGNDHAKFTHSSFSQLSTDGLRLEPAADYGNKTLTRNSRVQRNAVPGWTADFKIEDRLNYLAPGAEVHLRCTDLTSNADAYTAESWTVRNATSTEQFWIPTLVTRRQAQAAPLASTFVAVLEPSGPRSRIRSIRRLRLETPQGAAYGDANVAVEVKLDDGRRDILILADVENPLALSPSLEKDKVMVQKETGVRATSNFVFKRLAN